MTEYNNNWERDALKQIALAGIKEQRRARRWGIFFKILGFAYLFVFLVILSSDDISDTGAHGKHTALIELSGTILPGEPASAENINQSLQDAFKNKNTVGIILRINSPGGTPVQAGLIHDEILRLRDKYPDTPVYTVISDICASGGYYVAAATERIFADKASLVGSIGVRLSSFGFVDAMKKLGVERRQLTAGKNKAMLDPFSPRDKEAEQHMVTVLQDTHEQFINAVKTGRGDRLSDDERLFSGLVWNGEQSLDMGLIDELGNTGYVAREIIGEETLVNYTIQPDLFERFTRGVAQSMLNLMMTRDATPIM